jgi:pyruvate dehydrogenase complex dehydrogenase (E1) component
MSTSFAPGAYVFQAAASTRRDNHHHISALRRASQSNNRLTQALAAIRESHETRGILLAQHADGRPLDARSHARVDRHGLRAMRPTGLAPVRDQVFLPRH